MTRITSLSITALAALGLTGCSDDHDHGDDVDAEACIHLDSGPFQDLVTSETRDSSAPGIADDHVAYTLELPASGTGYVFFGAGEAGDFAFFFDQAVDVELTDSAGAVVAPEETATSSPACGTIQLRNVWPLEVGTYYLEVSSTAVPEVNVVVEHLVHDDHEH